MDFKFSSGRFLVLSFHHLSVPSVSFGYWFSFQGIFQRLGHVIRGRVLANQVPVKVPVIPLGVLSVQGDIIAKSVVANQVAHAKGKNP